MTCICSTIDFEAFSGASSHDWDDNMQRARHVHLPLIVLDLLNNQNHKHALVTHIVDYFKRYKDRQINFAVILENLTQI
jgi:hypothetical protein